MHSVLHRGTFKYSSVLVAGHNTPSCPVDVPPTFTYLPYRVSGSTLTAIGRSHSVAGPMAWNSLPDFIRDPTSSTDCFRRLLKTYSRSRVTSASSELGVLNDYALYKSTHSLTHSCQAGLKTKRPRNCYNGPYGPLIVALPPVTSLRRFSSSDHGIDAGGRYRSINNKQQTGCTSLPLSVYGTDGRTDGRTQYRYIDAYRILFGQRQ